MLINDLIPNVNQKPYMLLKLRVILKVPPLIFAEESSVLASPSDRFVKELLFEKALHGAVT